MAGIQSATGLITGIPIEETVNKLMAIAERPRKTLEDRTKLLQSEQLAVNQLTSLVLAFQFESNRFASENAFVSRAVKSSDTSVLTASVATGATPAVGSYKVRALQTASSQQLVSNSFASASDLASTGKLSFGFGGFLDTGVYLDTLNGGQSVVGGRIRITDRAGNSAEIDLRAARTVDDFLRAVNNNAVIDVTASVDGDRFVLTDTSGGSGNLRVQEVGTGTTAAGLGLSGINFAADSATGADVVRLGNASTLASLNDGNGVELRAGNDLSITLRDGTSLQVDLGNATTVGEVLAKLNTANPAKLSASIAADGNRLQLTDLTSGGGSFAVSNVGVGTTATDLGLTASAGGGVISGRRLISGLRDTLASSLRGGQGLGTLGAISITNRSNVTSSVNLSGAETLAEAIAAINAQATGVTATLNSARNGILLTDTTGGTASNLIVADADANQSATRLGIATNAAQTTVNSGTLARQQISRATLLTSLNQGRGVSLTDFRITDTAGRTSTVDMNSVGSEAKTIGDVIDRINALGNDVEARINETGDGILVIDRAGGTSKLQVVEVGTGRAAADLRLLGVGQELEVDGQTVTAIDGTARSEIDLSGLDDPGANVLLTSLDKGKGYTPGAFRVTDSAGQSAAIVLNPSAGTFTTVADVLNAINDAGIGVEARLNTSKTGILLFDTAGGNGQLAVEELAGGKTAESLGLTKAVKTVSIDGQQRQAIDGLGTFTQPADSSALATLVTRINSLSAGVTASTVFDGQSYRLSFTVDETGAGRDLLVDGLAANLKFTEFSFGQDAVIELGGNTPGTGVVVTSSTNKFGNVVSGLEVTIVEPSDKAVTLDVTVSSSGVLDVAQDFVDAYNSLRSFLDDTTSFDPEDLTTGILFGTQAALRTGADIGNIVTGRFAGVGQFTSLAAVGISIDDKGKLALDKTKLQAAFDKDPGALTKLFTDSSLGVSAKLKTATDRLVSGTNSALASRTTTLAKNIEKNHERIEVLNEQLDRQRERLLAQFTALESTIATLQRNLTALSALQVIPPLSINRSSQ